MPELLTVLKSGPVVDIVYFDPPALAVCVCEHGRIWREGADWGDVDGTSCQPCSTEAVRLLNLELGATNV